MAAVYKKLVKSDSKASRDKTAEGSVPTPASLNRQKVLLLSSRGVTYRLVT